MAAIPIPFDFSFPVATTRQTASGLQYALFRHAHHPGYLASLAAASFVEGNGQWSRKQQNALHAIHERAEVWRGSTVTYEGANSFGEPSLEFPSEENMQLLISLYSDIFFLGNLNGVVFKWDSTLFQRAGANGVSCYDPNLNIYTITMDPVQCVSTIDPRATILSVLLHECTHTLFYMYCCTNHTPDCPDVCRQVTASDIGSTGHGSAWIQLASHVQASARSRIHPDINLNIGVGMEYEFRASGRIPDAAFIAGDCHVDSSEMLQSIWEECERAQREAQPELSI